MYNLFNKFLSDISALLLHTCVQLRQPYKLVETTQSFLQCRHDIMRMEEGDHKLTMTLFVVCVLMPKYLHSDSIHA